MAFPDRERVANGEPSSSGTDCAELKHKLLGLHPQQPLRHTHSHTEGPTGRAGVTQPPIMASAVLGTHTVSDLGRPSEATTGMAVSSSSVCDTASSSRPFPVQAGGPFPQRSVRSENPGITGCDDFSGDRSLRMLERLGFPSPHLLSGCQGGSPPRKVPKVTQQRKEGKKTHHFQQLGGQHWSYNFPHRNAPASSLIFTSSLFKRPQIGSSYCIQHHVSM